jgi:potassium uptake TrkH family protein
VRTALEREFGRVHRPFLRSPAQSVAVAFAGAIAAGTALLMLPVARTDDAGASFLESLFTATSALCVVGLTTVDVSSYWSPTGQAIILVLIQLGGFGIMAMASLLGLLVARRLGLRSRVTAASETNTVGIGDVREVIAGIVKVSLLTEAVVAVALTLRFWLGYDATPGRAAWLGVFHAVSGFNNAGFTLWSDSLVRFAGDPFVLLPLCVAVILGGIGFPVLFELRKRLRTPRAWSLHTRLTLWGTLVLLVGGFVFLTAVEWSNPATLGSMDAPTRVLNGFVSSVMPRSAGLNTLDHGELREASMFAVTVLMFIGGGSASVAGGIKVGTFFLLFYVMLAEARGERDVEVFDRRVGPRTVRQAITVGLTFVGLVLVSTLLLLLLEPVRLNEAMFEVVSAFSTAGLSTGITADLGTPARTLLVFLMFVGRIGPVTLVSALALRERGHLYQLPEGRPLIG